MNFRIKNITPAARVIVILLMAVITPVLLFSVYEITTSGEAEQMMQDAYVRQLDAILFSANQFSNDAITAWKKEIEVQKNSGNENLLRQSTLFSARSPVVGALFADSSLNRKNWIYRNAALVNKFEDTVPMLKLGDRLRLGNVFDIAEKELENATFGINRLIRFSRQNYYRTETIRVGTGHYYMFVFVCENTDREKTVGVLIADREKLISDVLLPRYRSIAGSRFTIGIIDSSTGAMLASSRGSADSSFTKKAGLWIMPDWEIGIRLEGVDLKAINDERKVYLILLIVLLNLLISAAVYFVYRSIRKEMTIALMKSEFVSNVSHELRTPLSLIGMFAETLESGRVKTEEKKQEYYGIIHQETKRLSRIVNKILNFSQIEAGVRKYNFEKHSINEVAESVFLSYQFHFQQKDFNASIQLFPDDIVLQMDKEAVIEGMINLLDNAMKYSRDNREISVKTGKKGDMAFIAVKDCGIGISAADRERIFEKFFRVSEGGTHNVKGTGLGLSIIKHIAEAHGGYIGLESTPGAGSTFTMYLLIQ